MDRQEVNKLILKEISEVVEKYPDLRFHQILQIINIVELDNPVYGGVGGQEVLEQLSKDKFYEESVKTLERIYSCKTNED